MTSSPDRLAARWITLAIAYFVLAVALGVTMGASHDFRLKGVHVHLNLLGWASMGLTGLIYRAFPQAAASPLARWHFILYQGAVPVMMAALAALLLGVPGMDAIVGAASVVVLIAVVLFAVAVARRDAVSALHVHQPQRAA